MIELILSAIDSLLQLMTGDSATLLNSLGDFNNTIYQFVLAVQANVFMPLAYSILGIFALLELHKVSLKMESAGTNAGIQMVIMCLVKIVVITKLVEGTSLLMESIYTIFTNVASQVSAVAGTFGGGDTISIDMDLISDSLSGMGFLESIPVFLLLVIATLVILAGSVLVNVISVGRFIEIFMLLAVAPLPLSTLPHDEHSSIAKNYLKFFSAVCLQGVLIYLYLAFFPLLISSLFQDASASPGIAPYLWAAFQLTCYAVLIIVGVLSTGKLAKSICNAM